MYSFLQKYSLLLTMQSACIYICILIFLYWLIHYFKINRKVSKKQLISFFVFIVYLMIVFHSTVFGRDTSDTMKYELLPLWSYWKVIRGEYSFVLEILLNYMMLIPIGFLIPHIFNKKINIRYGLLLGLCISCLIELLQLVLCRGLFEWDDILHNGIGCMIGCYLGNKIIERFKL